MRKTPAQILPETRHVLAAGLREEYEAGASIRHLAYQRHLAYGTIHRLLLEAGTTLRSRGGARQAGHPHTPASAR